MPLDPAQKKPGVPFPGSRKVCKEGVGKLG